MLNKKTRLCVEVMAAMASAPSGALVTAQTLSEKLRVSISHLESIVRVLREADLLRSVRGPGGGYCLARDPGQISIWDVVCRVDDSFQPHPLAEPEDALAMSSLEEALDRALIDYLSSRTIDEFADANVAPDATTAAAPSRFRFGPMPERLRPSAPNSVFQLSSFLHMAAA